MRHTPRRASGLRPWAARFSPRHELQSMLSAIIFLPTVGAVALLVLDRRDERRLRLVALAVSVATFLLSLLLWIGFDRGRSGMQFEERQVWIAISGISYHLGVDGISL